MPKCNQCEEWKDFTFFTPTTLKGSINKIVCRVCQKEARLVLKNANLKRCTGCGELKDPSSFHKDSNKVDGLRSECKECRSKARATSELKRTEKQGE